MSMGFRCNNKIAHIRGGCELHHHHHCEMLATLCTYALFLYLSLSLLWWYTLYILTHTINKSHTWIFCFIEYTLFDSTLVYYLEGTHLVSFTVFALIMVLFFLSFRWRGHVRQNDLDPQAQPFSSRGCQLGRTKGPAHHGGFSLE